MQKKCVVASASIHSLLVLVLFVGPAFVSSDKDRPTESQIIDFIPMRTIDEDRIGGGNPNVKPQPAVLPAPVQPPEPVQPPAPKPEPKPEPKVEPKVEPKPEPKPAKVVEPEPPKDTRDSKPDPEALEPRERKTHKVEVNTTLTTRKSAPDKAAERRRKEEADEEARQLKVAETRRSNARELASTISAGLRQGASSPISVEIYGPGGGGETHAGYDSVVQSKYFHAWQPPDDIANANAIARATVIILKDGTVQSAFISTSSNDSKMDQSVRMTLNRVKFIAPFPESAKDERRTYIIKFDLSAKRLMG